jgi:hypothetical protein
MPRYIDADKLVAWCTETAKVQSTPEGKAYVDAFLTAVFSCTTADVVPEREVDELEREFDELAEEHSDLIIEKDHLFDEVERLTYLLHCYALQYGTVKDQQAVIDKAKTEVAREIFDEMQSCLIQRHWNGLDIISFEFDAVKYAELKKKYQEGEPNG